jgi:hypothetical protein
MVLFCTVLMTWGGLQATQVRRVIEEGKEPLFIDNAEYELQFKAPSGPIFVPPEAGRKGAVIFQYNVEHRAGVRLPSKFLKPGDMLLEPLYVVSTDGAQKVEILPAGHEIVEKDLIYIMNREYRQYYDASGTQLYSDAFKVGDTLDVYTMSYDDFGLLVFEESGLQTMDGKTLIENGTVLNEAHVAMLRNATPFPVKVRQKIDLELEFYLRVDWPDAHELDDRMYWMYQQGSSNPTLLYSYQIKPGDKPLVDIVNLDHEVICAKGQAITLEGDRNSIEVLERFPDAKMVSLRGRKITSVDPISKDPNDTVVKPGELVLAPKNRGEFLRPYLISGPEEMNEMLSSGQLSLARGYGEKTGDSFPFMAYLTHYTIPFYRDCIGGCDAMLNVLNDVVKGSHECKDCKKTVTFRPYVYPEVSGYSYRDMIWKESPINCAYCDLSFMRYRAHALCGEDGAFEYDPMALNVIYPTRLRASRLTAGATLGADVTYFKNGKEIVFEKGTPITPELRIELEKRATSPIYLEEPYEERHEAAQCPRCFAWNHKPLETFSLKANLTVDQLRRGMATFDFPKGKFNKLELVTFGLIHEVEPTSGRSMAKVTTFKRVPTQAGADEIWKMDSERWEYLPRYSYEKGMVQPVSLTGESANAAESIDLFEDF